MKKKRITIFAMLVLTVTTLAFTLSGCKQFNLSNSFTEEFGSKEYYGLDVDKLEKVTTADTILGAYGKMAKNFETYNNVAYRMITSGTAKVNIFGTSTDIEQKVYTTYIKSKNTLLNTNRIYYEDSATSKSKLPLDVGKSIVKMMYDQNAKIPYLVKYSDKNIGEDNNGYPTSAEDNFVFESYDNKEDFIEKYHIDLDAISIYNIDNNTIDVEKSTITEDKNGFIEVKFVFKSDMLEYTTLQRRGVIALKTTYGGLIKNCTADDVNFSHLSVTFKLWKNGYIREMNISEKYVINAMGTQNCDFTSTAYFSHDPEELPIGNFEFKKP